MLASQEVPKSYVDIYGVGSVEGGSLLLEAYTKFEAKKARDSETTMQSILHPDHGDGEDALRDAIETCVSFDFWVCVQSLIPSKLI